MSQRSKSRSRSRSRSRSPPKIKEGKQEIVEPNLETIPQEILEMIVEKSGNIRNVRQASKSLRYDLGGPLGGLSILEQPSVFSAVKKYFQPQDVMNLRLVSSGGYKLTTKEWERRIQDIIKNQPIRQHMILPVNSSVSFIISEKDVKICDLLFLLFKNDPKKFDRIFNYAYDQENLGMRAFVYLAVKEGVLGITKWIEKMDLYRQRLIPNSGDANLLNFAVYQFINETDEKKREQQMKMILELFEFGFNPAFKPASQNGTRLLPNVYEMLGKENAEQLFGPETNYSDQLYALENSRLDALYPFPKKVKLESMYVYNV